MNPAISLSDQLSLIRIKPEDQPQLFDLMNEVYRASYRYIWHDEGDWYVDLIYRPETVLKELSRSRSHYFFVEWKGEKLGILKYDFPFSPRVVEIPNSMKLHRLYLHPKAHGTGIGRLLIDHCISIAKENQLESIWLEAMECQAQAMRFYQKLGFQKVLTYTLDFEQMIPDYRQIQIMKLSLS